MAQQPVRSCIGCRDRHPAHAMFRLNMVDGQLVVDGERHGRGASMCRSSACIEAAVSKKAFSRAFRSNLADRVLGDTLLGWLGKPTH